MPTPDPRHERHSPLEPYIEERTFYSAEEYDGEPSRAYHVRRVNVGHGWSYEVSMEVVAKQAAEDVLGRTAATDENTRDLWGEIWKTGALSHAKP